MSNKKEIQKEKTTQAVVVADTFSDEFLPITNAVPHALLPVLNKPLIDYTLEFLCLGGIEEVFLFCCSHAEEIKQHISKCINNRDGWILTMKVNVIVSESCQSFGDCLRDLDAKGLIRGDFVLLEPGVISNIPLLPLLEKHRETVKKDKYAAMTIILQEFGIGHIGWQSSEDILLATDCHNRILLFKQLGKSHTRKVEFPIEIFLENSTVNLLHNLKDTRIAICSPSVLPLYSDNFDFQTKDDLIRGLLMNEEILEGTIYTHILQGSDFGGAISSWKMYQAISKELMRKWIHPLDQPRKKNKIFKNGVVIGAGTQVTESSNVNKTILGPNVKIGKNVTLNNCFIFSDTKIEDNVSILHSVIGPECVIKANSRIFAGSIIGKGVVIENGVEVENSLIQAEIPQNGEEFVKLGNKAYQLKLSSENDRDVLLSALYKKTYRLRINDVESDEEHEVFDDFSDTEDELSYTQSPVPDDTKLFFNEVIDSLTRGFEDNLLCDNLILEINSSRYAYNVTVKEVNFNVVKAILCISVKEPIGVQYFSHLSRLLSYFAPVLKNYLRNESAMLDSLQALEDVATSNENVNEKWIIAILQHVYNKDYITEDVILDWFNNLDQSSKFRNQVKPFAEWLQEAEEASSEEEESD
ncbi:translation initiation factor eIF-2B subunit epsilon [Diorhabda carinulata]|uniref:translation initiation factor eIF-2B subunit epsilon n=1 Tax=Diorhabda carinulata TaxID=1163345 RepID=UPI0025A0D163|nr:translation initiation factor eIF-2B subunit epsilon [Diorhabda carinulata]